MLIVAGASCGYLAHPPAAPPISTPANLALGTIHDDTGQADEPDDGLAADEAVEGFARVSLRPERDGFAPAAPIDGRANAAAPLDDRELVLRIFSLVNLQRRTHGLSALEFSPALARAALEHSRKMATHDFFDHQVRGEQGLLIRVAASGDSADHVGENLFESTGLASDGLAEDCVKMWMWSAGHRSVMLEPGFAKTGVAIGRSADGRNYITEDFAQ